MCIMSDTPRSEMFDDIYFSLQDGAAETRYVFLEGNGLPYAWKDSASFTICETGFGTGLNFLCAWTLFEQTALPAQRLEFISFEKYPLSAEEIERYLRPMVERDKLQAMLRHYPLRAAGTHKLFIAPQVTVTLLFGDVNEEISKLHTGVDAWFLDGFAPAKNPDMWRATLFQNMARLSSKKTTFATFTAAGAVKRGLQEAGFTVEKVAGFGRKRDMLKGRFA